MTSCEHHPEHGQSKTCRVCKSEYCHPSAFGICEKCGYKILIGLVIVMVIISYTIWFNLL